MKTAFIATVGRGDLGDIRPVLRESIFQANPDFLLLFATRETHSNAEDIRQELKRTDENSLVHDLRDLHDVERLFKEMLDVVNEMMRTHDTTPESITADFTSGTKTMSAALVLVATRLNFGRLKYVTAARDEEGRVITGGERATTFKPLGLQASALLDSAISLMRQYRFDAVRQLLQPIQEHLLSDSEQATRTNLCHLAEAYSYWDLFLHIRFKDAHDKVGFGDVPKLAEFRASQQTVSTVMDLGQKLRAGELTDLTIVDLINNARRRKEEGRFDDAVARLYRACEMLAQWSLYGLGLNTGNVDLTRVPEKSKEWLSTCRGDEGRIEIGLHKAYRLLADFGEQRLSQRFGEDNALRALLKGRNNSILAHGTHPIALNEAEALLKNVEGLAKEVIPDYDQKSETLRFPWSPNAASDPVNPA